MTLDNIIQQLKEKLFQDISLELAFYYFINDETEKLNSMEKKYFSGEVDNIALHGYLSEFVEVNNIELIEKRLKNKNYKKSLNVFHFIGLALQDRLNDTNKFDEYIQNEFVEHSFKYKYLLAKIFNKFEYQLVNKLKTVENNKLPFILVLKSIYLEESINKNQIIQKFEKEIESLDIIDLLLLEDLQNIGAIGYDKIQNKLFTDILKMSVDIQTKHKNQNNNEDQYNSLFQSLLSFSGYVAHDQAQRGTTKNNKRPGELDIQILTKGNLPISIFEAFVIESVDSNYIKDHLIKLSENYDPNGLRYNYAVVYAKNKKFDEFWERYKAFVSTVEFKNSLVENKLEDITDRHPKFAGIKIGLAKHYNRKSIVNVYHIFMDMNFNCCRGQFLDKHLRE